MRVQSRSQILAHLSGFHSRGAPLFLQQAVLQAFRRTDPLRWILAGRLEKCGIYRWEVWFTWIDCGINYQEWGLRFLDVSKMVLIFDQWLDATIQQTSSDFFCNSAWISRAVFMQRSIRGDALHLRVLMLLCLNDCQRLPRRFEVHQMVTWGPSDGTLW